MNPGNTMRVNRFVLDTNVWISYFITKREDFLLHNVFKHKLSIFICDELIFELQKVVEYPHLRKYEIDKRYAVMFVKKITLNFELSYPIKNYIYPAMKMITTLLPLHCKQTQGT